MRFRVSHVAVVVNFTFGYATYSLNFMIQCRLQVQEQRAELIMCFMPYEIRAANTTHFLHRNSR